MTTSRADALRAIEREIGVLIRRVRRVIGVRARAVHPELQPASYLILTHLDERGPARSSAVVEELGIDKGAVSRQMQHLVELGLLVRTPDPEDGRASLLSLSAEARTRLDRVRDERWQLFDELLAAWSVGDLTGLAAQLTRYNAALEAPRVPEDDVP
jgi:DNA-binding MarR family transcriptional regulator